MIFRNIKSITQLSRDVNQVLRVCKILICKKRFPSQIEQSGVDHKADSGDDLTKE